MYINNMLSTTHTLTSLPFAFLFDNPILIFISTIIWHFTADTIYHWNFDPADYASFPYLQVALDVSLGPAIALLLLGSQFFTWPILLAILGGNLPDIIHSLWHLSSERIKAKLTWLKPFINFHNQIQWETKNVFLGLIPQSLCITIALIFLAR